jgi:hypothetical protein
VRLGVGAAAGLVPPAEIAGRFASRNRLGGGALPSGMALRPRRRSRCPGRYRGVSKRVEGEKDDRSALEFTRARRRKRRPPRYWIVRRV